MSDIEEDYIYSSGEDYDDEVIEVSFYIGFLLDAGGEDGRNKFADEASQGTWFRRRSFHLT